MYLPRGQLAFVAEGSILDAGEVVRVTCYSGSGALRFEEVAEVLEREQLGDRLLVEDGKTFLLICSPSFRNPSDDALGLLTQKMMFPSSSPDGALSAYWNTHVPHPSSHASTSKKRCSALFLFQR